MFGYSLCIDKTLVLDPFYYRNTGKDYKHYFPIPHNKKLEMFFKNLFWSLQNMQEMTGEMHFAWGFGVGFFKKKKKYPSWSMMF